MFGPGIRPGIFLSMVIRLTSNTTVMQMQLGFIQPEDTGFGEQTIRVATAYSLTRMVGASISH